MSSKGFLSKLKASFKGKGKTNDATENGANISYTLDDMVSRTIVNGGQNKTATSIADALSEQTEQQPVVASVKVEKKAETAKVVETKKAEQPAVQTAQQAEVKTKTEAKSAKSTKYPQVIHYNNAVKAYNKSKQKLENFRKVKLENASAEKTPRKIDSEQKLRNELVANYEDAFVNLANAKIELAKLEIELASKGDVTAFATESGVYFENIQKAVEVFNQAREKENALPQQKMKIALKMSDAQYKNYRDAKKQARADVVNAAKEVGIALDRLNKFLVKNNVDVAEGVLPLTEATKQPEAQEQQIKAEQTAETEKTEAKLKLRTRIWNKIKSPFQGFVRWYNTKCGKVNDAEQGNAQTTEQQSEGAVQTEQAQVATESKSSVSQQSEGSLKDAEEGSQTNAVSKTFVFDVDGTIVDKKGNVLPGVKELFTNILKTENAKIMFLSSNSVAKLEQAHKEIEQAVGQQFPVTLAGYNGAVVSEANKQATVSAVVSKENYNWLLKTVTEIDPRAYVCVLTEDGGFYQTPEFLTRKDLKAGIYKHLGLGKLAQAAAPENIEKMLTEQKVHGIAVMPYNKNKAQEITNAISELKFDNLPNLNAQNRGVITAFAGDKWDFLKSYLNEEELQQTTFFGDGAGDIECLKNIDNSFAVGNNLQVLQAGRLPVRNMIVANEILFEGRNADVYMLDKSVEYDLIIDSLKHQHKAKKQEKKQAKLEQKGTIFQQIKNFFVGKKQVQPEQPTIQVM